MKKLSELKFSHLSGVIQRALCALATFLVVFALLIAGVTPDQYDIHVGQPASKSIYATKDVEDTRDHASTARGRRKRGRAQLQERGHEREQRRADRHRAHVQRAGIAAQRISGRQSR